VSARIEVNTVGDEQLARRLLALSHAEFDEVLDIVGGLVESQVRRRIQDEKTDPEGGRWAPWSESYERTRHGNQSLLQNEGDLLDSIQYLIRGDELEVGSNLVYAATHQFGDRRLAFGRTPVTIPARPYLGLSNENEAEIVGVLTDFLDDLARGRRR
jgi:phage virion morphogenesis protein